MSIDRFSPEVQKKLGYYVYRLIDPRTGQTFYVGKGKNNRVFAHIKDALKEYDGESYLINEEDEESLKIKQIRDIHNSGLEVIHLIQRYGLTENEAFEVESAIIDCFPALTNIQNGHAHERGVNNADTLEKDLSVKEFVEPDLNYMIIKIIDYWIGEMGTIYDTVRGDWKVSLPRAQKIPYVLAANNGIVVGVYKINKWYESPRSPGRYMFDGEEAPDDIKAIFLHKRLPKKYMKKGAQSHFFYHEV